MMVGVEYTAREYCDGQSLASPGRWPVNQRRYPTSKPWQEVSQLFMAFAEREGSTQLLTDLALGKVKECPFGTGSIRDMKESFLVAQRNKEDKGDIPIDFRYLQLLLTAAEDPEVTWDRLRRESESDPGQGCRGCQHCTLRRRCGASLSNRTRYDTRKREFRQNRSGGGITVRWWNSRIKSWK